MITICNAIWQAGPTTIPMNKVEPRTSNEPASAWHVYIVCCRDNSYYTGITTDLLRRMEEHNSARKGAKYTRTRRPVELVYSEKAASRSIATRREEQIKKLPLASKKELINCPPAHFETLSRADMEWFPPGYRHLISDESRNVPDLL